MTESKPAISPVLRSLFDYGPLVVFLVANSKTKDPILATGIFMVVFVLATGISYYLERKLAPMAKITFVLVLVFGGMTVLFNDETFIQLKPTIIYGLLASVLLGGLAMGKVLLQPLLGSAMQLDDEGWRGMSLRWSLFFVVLAILNEVMRRVLDFDGWLNFKVWGTIILSFGFVFTQLPYLAKHQLAPEGEAASEGESEA